MTSFLMDGGYDTLCERGNCAEKTGRRKEVRMRTYLAWDLTGRFMFPGKSIVVVDPLNGRVVGRLAESQLAIRPVVTRVIKSKSGHK